jgi:hemoglobin
VLEPEQSLYQRLGGYDAIAAFADDFLPRVTGDVEIGVYWRGKCKDSMRRERQLLIDFLCAATGGPVFYAGRDMKTAHEGLGISERDWDIMVRHAAASLEDLGVRPRELDEALSAVAGLKSHIVEVRQAAGARA